MYHNCKAPSFVHPSDTRVTNYNEDEADTQVVSPPQSGQYVTVTFTYMYNPEARAVQCGTSSPVCRIVIVLATVGCK